MNSRYSITQKSRKKNCIVCFEQPIDILMLACDHSICLQCAYNQFRNGQQYSKAQQIQFKCKCSEITYLDLELIKQIETSIVCNTNHVISKGKNAQNYSSQKPNQILANLNYHKDHESFIQKMKKQYCLDKKVQITNHDENKQSVNLQSFLKVQFQKSYEKIPPQQNYHTFNIPDNISFNNKNVKQNSQLQLLNKIQANSSKCLSHLQYDLAYFCQSCLQVVCSQCLLRGKHRGHQNQQLCKILRKQLPNFIKQTTKKLLTQIDSIEQKKQRKYEEIQKKKQQIIKIKSEAERYFSQIRMNIQRQQREVLSHCECIVQKFVKQQTKIEQDKNKIQEEISKHIKNLKKLKLLYEKYTDYYQQGFKHNKWKESLIHQFISHSADVKNFFNNKKKENQQQLYGYQNEQEKQFNQSANSINQSIMKSCQIIRQSLIFQSFADNNNKNGYSQNRLTKDNKSLKQSQNNNSKIPKYKQLDSKYSSKKSYFSTQNSCNKSKQIQNYKNSISPTISPYKYLNYSKPEHKINQKIHSMDSSIQFLNRKSFKKQRQGQIDLDKNSIVMTKNQKSRLNTTFQQKKTNIIEQKTLNITGQKNIKHQQKRKFVQQKTQKYRKKQSECSSNNKQNKKSDKKQLNYKSIKKTYKNIAVANINKFRIC